MRTNVRLPFEDITIDNALMQWLQSHPEYALLMIPVIAFAEACVGIGLFVSGIILFAVSTLLVDQGILGLWQIAPLAFLGALVGDHLSFFLGRRAGPHFHQWRIARRYRLKLARGEALVVRYGGNAIFLGRFIPAIRSLLPAMLGLSRYNPLRFSLLDLAACFLWSLALIGLVALSARWV